VPVRKLRSLQEAEDSLVNDPKDPGHWASIAALWELSERLFPRRFPPGVYKYRSIEALNKQRDAWEAEAIGSGREPRSPTPA